MKYAALLFGDDERPLPKKAAEKSSPEPGQVVRSIDGSVYRVASKIAGPDGVVVKLANLQGKLLQTPPKFHPVGVAVAHFASWLRYHLAHNKDFDLYINSYIERYNQHHKKEPLPYPVGYDGKAFRWADWFQKVVSPKLFVGGHGDVQDQQEIKDELIHEMLFTTLGHRNVLDQFVAKAKKLGVNRQNAGKKLTDFLISTFMYRIDEMQNKLREQMPEEEVSMWQPNGYDDMGDVEVNLLDTEEHATKDEEFQSVEARKDVAKFREAFRKWLLKTQGQKSADSLVLMLDIFWRLLQRTDSPDSVKRSELQNEWIEKTGLSFGSFKEYFNRLPDMIEEFITSHGTELGNTNIFIDLMNTIRNEREERERKTRRQKERARPAMAASLRLAGVEGDFAEAIRNSENPDVADPDIKQPTESLEEAAKVGAEKMECLKCHKKSDASDCNNLQCPHCGGNMKTAGGVKRMYEDYLIEQERAQCGHCPHAAHENACPEAPNGCVCQGDSENKQAGGVKRMWEEDIERREQLLATIRPGDRVTILVPAGMGREGQEWTERTGKAVIISPGHVALNMGGQHGTPGVATADNLVSVRKAKQTASTKIAQQLIRGDQLTPEQVKQVLNAFIYRWTKENEKRVPTYLHTMGGECPSCDIRNPYVNETSAEGHQHPTIALQNDVDWLREHAFSFTNAGKLMPRGHAEPAYLAPDKNQILASVAQKFAMEKAAYNPGKGQYIFQADVYCEPCGKRLEKEMWGTVNDNGDSDTFPQGPYYDQESDAPEHCARCGVFLENPLTTDGYNYLNSMITEFDERGQGNSDVIEEWKAYYPEREDYLQGIVASKTAADEYLHKGDPVVVIEQRGELSRVYYENKTEDDAFWVKTKTLKPRPVKKETGVQQALRNDPEALEMFANAFKENAGRIEISSSPATADQVAANVSAFSSLSEIDAVDYVRIVSDRSHGAKYDILMKDNLPEGLADRLGVFFSTTGLRARPGEVQINSRPLADWLMEHHEALPVKVYEEGQSKAAMIGHMFDNADGQAIRNETYPNTDYVSGEADTTEFRQNRMGADQELWKCMDCDAVGPLDVKGGNCSTCGSAAVFALPPQPSEEAGEIVRETKPIEIEKRMVPRRTQKPLPLGASAKNAEYTQEDWERDEATQYRNDLADEAEERGDDGGDEENDYKTADGSTTVTMQTQNATIPTTPGRGEPMAVPDAIDQTAGPHSPNAPATAPRSPGIQPRVVDVPAGTVDDDMAATTASVDDPEDISCPECHGHNVDIDALGDEGYQIYCEDCEKTTFEGRLVPGRPARDYREMPGEHANEPEFLYDEQEPPEEPPFDEREASDKEAGLEWTAGKFDEEERAFVRTLPESDTPCPDCGTPLRTHDKEYICPRCESVFVDENEHVASDDDESIYRELEEEGRQDKELSEEIAQRNQPKSEVPDRYWEVWSQEQKEAYLVAHNWVKDDSWHGATWWMEKPMWTKKDYEETIPYTDTDDAINEELELQEEGQIKEGAGSNSGQDDARGVGDLYRENFYEHRTEGLSTDGLLSGMKEGAAAVAPSVAQAPNVAQNMAISRPQPPMPGTPGATMAIMPGEEEEGAIKRHTVEPELPNAKYHMQGALILAEERRLTKEAFSGQSPQCRGCREVKPDVMWHEFPDLGEVENPTQQLEGYYCDDCALEMAQDI